jgi:hypothetical protein
MAAQRQYATVGAFRTALEARLNERAVTGRTAAQMEVEIEQDGPERQQLGEHGRISRC